MIYHYRASCVLQATAAAVMALSASLPAYALAEKPITEIYPIGEMAGPLGKKWQPSLMLRGSCAPFAAVDWWGNWSAGLKATGLFDGSCGKAVGNSQVYYRARTYGGYCGIMYAWYFPKDSWAHRHDWENVIVWLKGSCSTSSALAKVSFSGHGSYKHVNGYSELGRIYYVGTSMNSGPRVTTNYDFSYRLDSAAERSGGFQTLVSYNDLPQRVKNSLNRSWGSANFPMGNAFDSNIRKAY